MSKIVNNVHRWLTKSNIRIFQGDLKQFLIATRKSSVGIIGNKERPAPLTIRQSLILVKQVASALECLTKLNNYTHRDVAARNCLITSSLDVKITFSSLCKTTYAAEYYPIRNQVRDLSPPSGRFGRSKFCKREDVYKISLGRGE